KSRKFEENIRPILQKNMEKTRLKPFFVPFFCVFPTPEPPFESQLNPRGKGGGESRGLLRRRNASPLRDFPLKIAFSASLESSPDVNWGRSLPGTRASAWRRRKQQKNEITPVHNRGAFPHAIRRIRNPCRESGAGRRAHRGTEARSRGQGR